MENLFKELAWKCYENGLHFDYQPSIYGFTITSVDEKSNHTTITRGYIGNWEWETPIDTLERMRQEVDEFIEIETMEDTEFDRPRGVSSGELRMKEAGHKISDFE